VIPASPHPGLSPVLETALGYLAGNWSLIPVRADGSKSPASWLLPRAADGKPSWSVYRDRQPTKAEVRRWFGGPQEVGIALLGGAVSGGAECIDFDDPELFEPWRDLIVSEAPDLLNLVSVVKTPAGYHVWLRSDCPRPNRKLAELPEAMAASGAKTTLIETRGDGGYALAPGCPPNCHALGLPYDHVSGPRLGCLPSITKEERETLFLAAMSFNRRGRADSAKRPEGESGSLGDDYDRRGPPWQEILAPSGWTLVSGSDDHGLWRRPGKDRGWSASTGVVRGKAGEPLFHVFTANGAPFQSDRNYGKFRAYAILNHSGDCSAAASALSRQGYGRPAAPGVASGPRAGPGLAVTSAPLPAGGALAEFDRLHPEVAAGRHVPVSWPWPKLTDLTDALIPGAITILCGPPGEGKSYFTLQAALHWLEEGVPVKLWEMEEGGDYWVRRALAQLSGESAVSSLRYQRANPRRVEELRARFGPQLERLDAHLTLSADAPPSWEQACEWLEGNAAAGARVLIVDPVTAVMPADRQHLQDFALMMRAKSIARKHGCSIIFVTHPRMNVPKGDFMDKLAGGAAFPRFASSVLYFRFMRREAMVATALGDVWQEFERTMLIVKARDGSGKGREIAFHMVGGTVRFEEYGVIMDGNRPEGMP
jgi:hypothetical protein